MGAYLSEPITKKESSNEVGKNVAFGASSMQGWRNSQEDAHNCCLDFDEDVSLFAVYDGHGGHEVATYCARNLPNFIKQTDAYKRGDIKQALIDAFLEFDATLTKPEVVSILKELAESSTSERKEDDATESDEEENVNNLCMEAAMPLEQVMAKYQSEVSNAHIKNLKNEMCGKHTSSGAGCSSSSSSTWNTNEADVSSSSQPCVSALSSGKERKESESTGSNEVEQILDSTTSNGNAHTSPPVGSTADVEPTKSADMPDSSEDVKEKVASPTKGVSEESSVNEVETNGKELNRIGDADSSKGGGDNVSSSSCTTIENGDAGQQERISSSGRRRVQTIDLYKRLLKKDDDNSEEDDDENDKTFDGVRVSFSDDEDSEDADEDESEEDEEDADENESEGDDKDEDDCDADEDADDENDDENDDIEEPGSDSGCTALVAILKGNELYVANAGDSRCVLCRDGFAVELTVDHKPEESSELSRIIRAGGEVTMDGRVNGGLNLSRALGDHAYKQNTSLPPQEQMISPLPDVTRITIEPERDEFLILACDGIWNFYSSEEVVDFIQPRLDDDYNNISDVCEELFDRCLAPDTFGNGAGCDNMTAIIIRFKPPSKETSSKTTTDAVCKVTKKRSVSPPATANNGNNDCTTEEKAINSCKRPKTEAAI